MTAKACFNLHCIFGLTAAIFSIAPCKAQSVDGLVEKPQDLVGSPIVVVPTRGSITSGTLSGIFQPKDDPLAIVHFDIELTRGRRRLKPDQIKAIRISDREMSLFLHLPSGSYRLVDIPNANESIDERLEVLKRERNPTYGEDESSEHTETALADIRKSIKKLSVSNQLVVTEAEHTILVTDYPARQSPGLVRVLDTFVPRMNEIFGFDGDEFVLPGKPIIALFFSRTHLGEFQTEVVNNPNFGTMRAFFHLLDGHVVVTAEDDRSLKNACWQAAWGLSGAYARFAYSTVVLPAWVRVGLQQHCADVIVPGLANHRGQLQRVQQELKSGSMNGLFIAEQLPLERQLVCKLIVAHLYELNHQAFGQFLSMLKLGRTADEALFICYGMNEAQLSGSFGRTLGMPQLKP